MIVYQDVRNKNVLYPQIKHSTGKYVASKTSWYLFGVANFVRAI